MIPWQLCALAHAQIVVDEVRPEPLPLFESVQDGEDGLDTVLNFEFTLRNASEKTLILDGLDATYDRGTWSALDLDRDELRLWLTAGGRFGWGLDRLGTAVSPLSAYNGEAVVDVSVVGPGRVYEAVGGTKKVPVPGGSTKVSAFVLREQMNHGLHSWQREIPFYGFEARANAVVATENSFGRSQMLAVGGAHPMANGPDPFAEPWEFAAVFADIYGAITGEMVIPFAGCSAEAVDVDPAPFNAILDGYFLTGFADCGAGKEIAVAAIDRDRNILWSDHFPLGGGGALTIGGGAVDDDGGLYVVGQWGTDLFATKLDGNGLVDVGWGVLGTATIAPTGFTDTMGYEALVQADGKLVVAGETLGSTGGYELGAGRFTVGGVFDPAFGPDGWTSTGFPSYFGAYGRDVAQADGHLVVSGYAAQGTTEVFALAAFEDDGDLAPAFDLDGRLVIAFAGAARSYRSDIDGAFLVVGGNSGGEAVATASVDLANGTPNDPVILRPGEERVLAWPQVRFDGASRPTGVTATIGWQTWPSGGASTMQRVQAFDTASDRPARRFPLEHLDDETHLWSASIGHDVSVPDGPTTRFPLVADEAPYAFPARFAYRFEQLEWDGEAWVQLFDGPSLDVSAMSDGEIIGCDPSGYVSHVTLPFPQDAASYEPGGVMLLTSDGDLEVYHGLDTVDPAVCPVVGDGPVGLDSPIEVRAGEVIGTAERPEVLVTTPWDVVGGLPDAPADGLPLLFDDVYGIALFAYDETPYAFLPRVPDVFPVAGLRSSLILLTVPPPPPPPPETSCEPVVDLGPLDAESRHADGDFGIDWFCTDDEVQWQCIDQGDDHGECESCAEEAVAGCPCTSDERCDGGLVCWGADAAGDGRCYPADHLPSWQCGFDCAATFGLGAWCFNDFYGAARCIDGLTTEMQALQCYERGWTDGDDCDDACGDGDTKCLNECSGGGGKGTNAGDCIVECSKDAECDAWGYPSNFECGAGVGVPICRLPSSP